MEKKIMRVVQTTAVAVLWPLFSHAQGVADDLHSLQGILDQLYQQMMTLCKGMQGVSMGIAGFAALWFIAARVWKHIASAEPIDILPLMRPFVIGCCIALFPHVLGLINGILKPVVTATQTMVTGSNEAIARLLADKSLDATDEQELGASIGDPDKWYQYSHPGDAGSDGGNSNPIADAFSGFSIKNWARKFISEMLNILFQAAALCLDTIRVFKLIVLSILGPLCFGLSVFDGFQHTAKQWIARYVNVFMWLPIANIFGAIIGRIQENMLLNLQSGNLPGNEFGNTNTAYMIFLLIGIVGYFTVPSVANYIMNVGGHALFAKTSALSSMAVSYVGGVIMQSFSKNSSVTTDAKISNDGNNHAQSKLSGKS
jgi:conjugative transposon TraJ protein